MKIAIISPNPAHLRDIGTVLESRAHAALLHEGGKSRMAEVVERDRPDLVLVDGICCDPGELVHVEQVTARQPDCAVILLCSTHTPEFLISAMRAGVREVLPSPPTRDALLAAVDRIAGKLKGTPSRRGKVLSFVGCKGGSGATFLATNFGWQLAESGSVLLVDLNLQFGDALSFLHDGKPASTLADVTHDIGRLDASLLAASTVKVGPNYSILPAPEDFAQAVEVQPSHVEAILELATAQYDYVIADLGRNLDPVAIKAFDQSWKVFPVMQLALPDVRNATRLVQAFRALGYSGEKVELIVNRYEKGGDVGLDHLERALPGMRVHTVANAYRDVYAAINHGDPLVRRSRGSAVVRQLAELARAVGSRQDEQRGLLGRLFRRA